MSIIIGSARSNESGSYAGGKKGDQRQRQTPDYGGEVSMQNFYLHRKGWYIFRPKSASVALRMADGMILACNNKYVGYSQQNDRYGVVRLGIQTTEPCNCDCSSLVRAVIKYATGKDVGDFNTAIEPAVLADSGLFQKREVFGSGTKLCAGDVLVTRTKGHTAIVVSSHHTRPDAQPTPTPTPSGQHVPLNYKVGEIYHTTQDMNIRTKKASEDPCAIPGGEIIGVKKQGAEVRCNATTLYNGKIYMYIGLDSQRREQWICADSGAKSYIS